MQRKLRSRQIAAAVFGVLAIVLIIVITKVDLGSVGREDEPTPTTNAPLFADTGGAVVTELQVTRLEDGAVLQGTVNDDASWTLVQAPAEPEPGMVVDHARIRQAVASLPDLLPTRQLSGIEAMAPYGLEEPVYLIQFRLSTGSDHQVYVGAANPTGSGYYVTTSETILATDVYLISKYSLDGVISLVDDPPYIEATPTPEPTATPEEIPAEEATATPEA